MRIAAIALGLSVLAAGPSAAMDATYDTPQAALDALAAALGSGNAVSVASALGPGAEDLAGALDEEIDVEQLAILYAAWREGYRFVPQDDDSLVIELGRDGWPFPVPLSQGDAGWQFDVAAGVEEITAREIGRNELDVLDLMAGYGVLQTAYRLVDYDEDGVMEFASSIISPAGARTGLYWVGQDSLVGDRAARASLDGFLVSGAAEPEHEPYFGYYYRVLTGQSASAPGGDLSYFVGDNMVAGHALLAVPAEYGVSGVHTFMVNEAGTVWEADLGETTLDIAFDMTQLDPDPEQGWEVLE